MLKLLPRKLRQHEPMRCVFHATLALKLPGNGDKSVGSGPYHTTKPTQSAILKPTAVARMSTGAR